MGYTIGQVAQKFGLTAHTLRYYDKEGLLPFLKKNASGVRVFSEQDVEWLVIIECLKGTGLQLKDIKRYIDLAQEGNGTLEKRLEMFKRQKEKLKIQMTQLNDYMEKIDYKIAWYEDAIAHGDVNVLERNKKLAVMKEKIFKNACIRKK